MRLIKKYIFIILIIVAVAGIIGGICFKNYLNTKEDNIEEFVQEDFFEEVIEEVGNEDNIFVSVDIKGAVVNPGVYDIENNKRVIDVVNMAGGFRDDADTSLVNLARGVIDEMVVVIYTKDQVKEAKKDEEVSIISNDICVCPKISNDACLNNSVTTNNTNNNSSKNNSNKNSSNDDSSSNNNSIDSNTNDSTNEESGSNDKVNINTATKEELMTLSGIGEGKAQAIIDYRNDVGNFSRIEDIMNVSGIGESVFEKIKEYITI